MKKNLSTRFNVRQYMNNRDFEIFYYHDLELAHVSPHKHSHYEFYFFLEGELSYEVDEKQYHLKTGDYLLIPPDILHRPHIEKKDIPYRRIVLWISKEYFHTLCGLSADFSYGFHQAMSEQQYHFRHDFIVSQEIQGKLIDLIEEIRSDHPFHELHCNLKIAYFLAYINRIIFEQKNLTLTTVETPLYLRVCDFIHGNLTEQLSLQKLSEEFYVSKYHISHTFKDNMGISLHQYILKKRLQAIKAGILTGMPLAKLAEDYGFTDYTSFFRAFKKEYHMSPKEFKEQNKL